MGSRAEETKALTCVLLFPLLISWYLAYLFFFFFRSLHSFWINFAHIPLAGLPDSFLYYGALLKDGSCCVFCHMPLDLSGVYHFLIIYFYLFIFSLFIPVAEREDNLFLRSWCLLVNRAHNPVSRSLASL